MYTVAAVITLSLPDVARQYAQADAPGQGGIQVTADALTGVRQDAILAGVSRLHPGRPDVRLHHRTAGTPGPPLADGLGHRGRRLPMLTACLLAASGRTPVTSYTT